jgi:hypothetical protein
MTPPRNGLRAHERNSSLGGGFAKLGDAHLERLGERVVSEAAEASVLPRSVPGVLASATQSSELRDVHVAKVPRPECGLQGIPIELRVVSRARHRADVRHYRDVECLEERDEVIEWSGRMTDGVDPNGSPALRELRRRSQAHAADGAPVERARTRASRTSWLA